MTKVQIFSFYLRKEAESVILLLRVFLEQASVVLDVNPFTKCVSCIPACFHLFPPVKVRLSLLTFSLFAAAWRPRGTFPSSEPAYPFESYGPHPLNHSSHTAKLHAARVVAVPVA